MSVPHPSDPPTEYRPPIILPVPPGEPTPYSFPVLATIAPVLGSGLIWAVTQSVLALVFAFLGPVIAVASLADATVQRRRRRRRERRRFEGEVSDTLDAIAERHRTERAARDAIHRGIRGALHAPGTVGWTASAGAALDIVVGRGETTSALQLDASAKRAREPDLSAILDSVMRTAIRLTDAPIVVDAHNGIGICGPEPIARALARACVMQLAATASPARTFIRSSGGAAWTWLDALPHLVEVGARRERTEFVEFVWRDTSTGVADPDSSVLVALADRADQLPGHCRAVIDSGSGRMAQLSLRGTGAPRDVALEFASVENALEFAAALRDRAEADGLLPATSAIPNRVPFEALGLEPAVAGRNDSLRCAIGSADAGPIEVDLVSDGPHAVIGGTTGSGKSELLITWVLALATRYPPSRVTFLLVDFKGGASFNAVRSLPHSVGLITDLDRSAAQRALESLRAELLFRERALVDAGARAIDDLPASAALTRLVIVVDEFAALASDFPELHALFADIAARGRSLGIHLILCTQRPADSLRDSILANCTLRASLRLNSRSDSVAVIGTGAAADLPRYPSGRALIVRAGEDPILAQIAVTDPADPLKVGRLWLDSGPVRRPWCDPLPDLIPHGELEAAAGGIAFGRTDLPAGQRQETAVYTPSSHGNLLIQGAHGSGKTTALISLAAGAEPAAVCWIPDDIEGAWDALSAVCEAITTGIGQPRLVLLDDADSLVARLGHEHELEFLELVARVLRDGPRHETTVAIAAQRIPSNLRGATALCDSRLLLRLSSREEHLLAGGRGDQYDPRLPPGGGIWDEHRVQVGHLPAKAASSSVTPDPVRFPLGGATAIVSANPREAAARLAAIPSIQITMIAGRAAASARDGIDVLRTAESMHAVLLGHPDDWQAAWALLGTVQGSIPMVFDGCSVSVFRSLSRSRELPPPLSATAKRVWLLPPDGVVVRAVLV